MIMALPEYPRGIRQAMGMERRVANRKVNQPSPMSRRIAQQLITDGQLDGDSFPAERWYIQRSYASFWQRGEGAWRWWLVFTDENGKPTIAPDWGSQWPATTLLRARPWRYLRDNGIAGKSIEPNEEWLRKDQL